jgi:hypothetical protein
MKIERHNYSRGAWRLLDDDGKEVYWSKPFKHSDLGWTHVSMPVCGETKAECIAETLALLGLALNRLRAGHCASPAKAIGPAQEA